MKKSFFSAAAALLLLLAMQPAARAEMTYPAPQGVEVGSELDHLVATVSDDYSATASDGTFPEGVQLEVEEADLSRHLENLYLRGVPRQVGDYRCVINLADEDGSSFIICPISVAPEAPAVTAGAPVRCYLNDSARVSVTATVSSGSLSYQWYLSASNSYTGSAIQGANQPEYRVNTSALGTSYYYCIVTNTSGSQTRAVTSGIIPVTVEELAVTSLAVETFPAKTVYTVGDVLDPAGLSLRVGDANGGSRVLSDTGAFSFYPTRLETAGTQNIEVSYQGLSCTFQVTVQPGAEQIQGIGVLTLPTKRDYQVGDTLDPAGLSIRVYTNNGQRDVTEGFICSPMAFDRAGTQTVTVSYEGLTCTFTLEIQEEEKPVSLVVATLPTKREYQVGDTLDTSGMVLQLITNRNNSQTLTADYICTPTVLETAGRQEVSVFYKNLSTSFSVTVKQPLQTSPPPSSTTQPFTPVPVSPNASAAPSAPVSPAPTSHVIEHQSHSTGASSALLVVIMVAALLGLGGIGAYVFIMNRGGMDGLSEQLKRFLDRFRKK